MTWTEKDQRESIDRLVEATRGANPPYPPRSAVGQIIWLYDALVAAEARVDRLVRNVETIAAVAWNAGADAQWETTDERLTNDSARNPYRTAQSVPSVVVFSDMETLETALDAALREDPEQ